jgi:ADP-ribose pyrophosphatase
MPLPPLPTLELQIVEDLSPREGQGFLRLARHRLRVRRADGSESKPFVYDSVHRPALDAVVVAAHYLENGKRFVFLRSSIRPPATLRPLECRPLPESATLGSLWELPAGLVEPDECRLGAQGLRRSAARELEEETGLSLEPEAMQPLGPANFPSAGVIGERHHFFSVEVDPSRRGTPTEDGSVLEEGALVVAIELSEAMALVRAGAIEDGKTEIALRRLAERLER